MKLLGLAAVLMVGMVGCHSDWLPMDTAPRDGRIIEIRVSCGLWGTAWQDRYRWSTKLYDPTSHPIEFDKPAWVSTDRIRHSLSENDSCDKWRAAPQ